MGKKCVESLVTNHIIEDNKYIIYCHPKSHTAMGTARHKRQRTWDGLESVLYTALLYSTSVILAQLGFLVQICMYSYYNYYLLAAAKLSLTELHTMLSRVQNQQYLLPMTESLVIYIARC